ncbi:PREDICTED: uncharacterized protein LOC101379915 [Odobenus rosmarus divergens]|uniref:Uncharacterized protein LOC101379915 n=1 Tax=Odobenus rosmarus divergens TaxID=9708 RepID=A0A9B0GQ65_ODORO
MLEKHIFVVRSNPKTKISYARQLHEFKLGHVDVLEKNEISESLSEEGRVLRIRVYLAPDGRPQEDCSASLSFALSVGLNGVKSARELDETTPCRSLKEHGTKSRHPTEVGLQLVVGVTPCSLVALVSEAPAGPLQQLCLSWGSKPLPAQRGLPGGHREDSRAPDSPASGSSTAHQPQ